MGLTEVWATTGAGEKNVVIAEDRDVGGVNDPSPVKTIPTDTMAHIKPNLTFLIANYLLRKISNLCIPIFNFYQLTGQRTVDADITNKKKCQAATRTIIDYCIKCCMVEQK